MKFYDDWKNCIFTDEEKEYIRSFLDKTPQSLETLLHGSKEELLTAYQVISETSIKKTIDVIESDSSFEAEDIVQFSNFNHAITNVCVCCASNEEGLTFNEIGKMIVHSKHEGACKKYGENHSKMAAELSLVELIKYKSYIVKATAIGSFTISLDYNEKKELIKRLAIRNSFIKSLIYHAKHKVISYYDLASKVLSESTLIRRKSNVKKIVTLILEGNEIFNNIIW